MRKFVLSVYFVFSAFPILSFAENKCLNLFNTENTNKQSSSSNWGNYYQLTANSPPRETLVLALSKFKDIDPKKLFAIDLGSGAGNDVIGILNHGWGRVMAVDREQQSIDYIQKMAPPSSNYKLQTLVSSFEKLPQLPQADLINASYSLPFCHPFYFAKTWKTITDSIHIGGRFSGNFFGKRDDWSRNNEMTFFSKADLELLFKDFEIEYFSEVEKDGYTASGHQKHWHEFFIIAKKIK